MSTSQAEYIDVSLPNEWTPRLHQWPLWDYLSDNVAGGRAFIVWHRRAGKDSEMLNFTSVAAHTGTPGMYWHLLPTQVQARKVVWNGIDRYGRKMIDQAFPEPLRAKTQSQEMYIEFECGSAWQLAGSDNFNSLVGANVKGVVFSEWALCDPAAWNYIRPIILENNGWAVFITTPRGRNHAWLDYERYKARKTWFVELLTVEDTVREDGTRIFTDEMVEEERADGMSEEMIAQEYYCSFAAGVVGTIYGRAMEKAYEEGRITDVPFNKLLPVHTYWDIGIDDATAVWFGQREQFRRQWFLYMEFKDTALMDVFDEIARLPYRYAYHNLPHDGGARDKGTGKQISEYASDIFGDNGVVVTGDAHKVQESIEVTRHLIGQSWFDETNCEHGIHCLLNYRRIWDEKRKAYQQQPHHDWSSHGCKALEEAGWIDADEPIVENVLTVNRPRHINVIRSV